MGGGGEGGGGGTLLLIYLLPQLFKYILENKNLFQILG